MTFQQARAAIEGAKDHRQLLEAMRLVSALAYWPTFTDGEQRELRRVADNRNRQLAEEARAKLNQWEARINGLVRDMGDPTRLS